MWDDEPQRFIKGKCSSPFARRRPKQALHQFCGAEDAYNLTMMSLAGSWVIGLLLGLLLTVFVAVAGVGPH
jgi:hypothetical protein